MKSIWTKYNRNILCAAVVTGLAWCALSALAAGQQENFVAQAADNQGQVSENATAAATADSTPRPQIDGIGTLNTPRGTRSKPVRFLISGVANDQATPQFLSGAFAYVDRRSHINFTTDKIETVTINGNQGAFTGTARIGGPRNKRTVQFTVTVTANGNFPSEDTFSIVLSNGYTASGNLLNGEIRIRDEDPD